MMGRAAEASSSFGELLRDHRRTAELTQEELAERAGVSVRTVSDLERGGAHVPHRDTVTLLVRALGLAGSDRAVFEEAVERRRGPQRVASLDAGRSIAPKPTLAGAANHNLPRLLSSFVGRERELREVGEMLRRSPLLTLAGTGGVGKTRLALELAVRHVMEYPDGVWLVELAALHDPSLVARAVASTLGVAESSGRSITDALVDYLRPRHLLLILDNCEHLIESSARLVGGLLGACPSLSVVATTREPLGIPGEVTWRVPPLEDAAAEQLFIDRARAVRNTFTPTDADVRAVGQICTDLDRIPLALELAAARLRAMSVAELAERLARDFSLLAGGSRVGQPNHRTLHATIRWSDDLLEPPERALLRRLSVFAGGWTLEAAELVCSEDGGGRGRVVDLLTQLVDKSMVVIDAEPGPGRYRLLEPIRQYAAQQLEAVGEVAQWRARHARGMLEVLAERPAYLGGREEVASLDGLEVEHDNVRAALSWFIAQREGWAALRLCTAMWRFWERRGHQQEGCAWIDQALAVAGDAPAATRGNAFNALAMLHWATGDAARAAPSAEQALALCRAAGDTRGAAWALISLGMIAYYLARRDQAPGWLEDSVSVARAAGDVPLLSLALSCLGRVLLWAHGPSDRRIVLSLHESLGLARSAESRHATGQALSALGELAWQQADPEHAADLWRQALRLRVELGDRRGLATSLEYLAWAAASAGRPRRAAWLAGAAEAQRGTIGLELRHDEQAVHAELLTTPANAASFAAVWADGQMATAGEAVHGALADA
jgi:non-specific serine/threonine protein kinase